MEQTGSVLLALAVPLAVSDPLGAAGAAWSHLVVSIQQAHGHAPALVTGLAALLAIPPLAIAGHILSRRRAAADAARRLARLEPLAEADETTRTGKHATVDGAPATARGNRADGLTWPVDAWIAIEGAKTAPKPIVHEIMRIGRDDDNDIVLDTPTVHRNHAVIQRTEDAEIVILDLSGSDGNGVNVNGKRVSRQRLRDGDKVTIGDATLRFSARRV